MGLTEAKAQVAEWLKAAQGDAYAVHRALKNAEHVVTNSRTCDPREAEVYPVFRFALADITGNPTFRD